MSPESIVLPAKERRRIHVFSALGLLPYNARALHSLHRQFHRTLEPVLGGATPRPGAHNHGIGGNRSLFRSLHPVVGAGGVLHPHDFPRAPVAPLLGFDARARSQPDLHGVSRPLQHLVNELARGDLGRVVPESEGADRTDVPVEPPGHDGTERRFLPRLLGASLVPRPDAEDGELAVRFAPQIRGEVGVHIEGEVMQLLGRSSVAPRSGHESSPLPGGRRGGRLGLQESDLGVGGEGLGLGEVIRDGGALDAPPDDHDAPWRARRRGAHRECRRRRARGQLSQR
mmetsp:Transcript_29364/g.87019  ORF Transcript_29364/g.87019 Transcript_29364/m.87019 type:complete len:285 (-) Transcript_29364:144-998(-)